MGKTKIRTIGLFCTLRVPITGSPVPKIQPRTFSKATQMANNFTNKVKEAEDDDMKLEIFKNGMHDVIREVVGVAFEKADVLELIANNPKFQALQYYDPTAVFSKDADSLQMGQILSMMANLQNSVEALAKTDDQSPQLVNRLEKVSE